MAGPVGAVLAVPLVLFVVAYSTDSVTLAASATLAATALSAVSAASAEETISITSQEEAQ